MMNLLILTMAASLPLMSSAPVPASAPGIRASLSRTELVANSLSVAPAPVIGQPTRPRRSAVRKTAGGLVGAAIGFFGGAFIGAQFTKDCGCDDPGLEGMIVGAPIGALVGAFIGAKYF